MSMENKQKDRLLEQLKAYGASDFYPFHMPGHKRNSRFMELPPVHTIDITEIDGFDDLHHAQGVLKEAQERAARVRGAGRTWFLVNGSTCGLLSAISACTKRGGHILMARNCHKSVYHAVELCGLHPVYIYPKIHPKYGIYEAVDSVSVEKLLKQYEDIQAVVITSPTYEGVISDITAIAQIVHRFGLPLIVDSAHGAHLGYGGVGFGASAVMLGADLVIESLHKTLPSMTQTALLHRCGHRVDDCRVQKYLSMYQTSSPSYVMMSAMDACMALLEASAKALFSEYSEQILRLRRALKAQEMSAAKEQRCDAVLRPHIRLLGADELCLVSGSSYDASKLVFFVENCRGMGRWLYDRFRDDYHLQMEMASSDYVLAMTSICDTNEGFDRLLHAVTELNQRLLEMDDVAVDMSKEDVSICTQLWKKELPQTPALSPEEASLRLTKGVRLQEAVGHMSGAYLYIYPPGVPFCVPGERITKEMLEVIRCYIDSGLEVIGLGDGRCSTDGTMDDSMEIITDPEE